MVIDPKKLGTKYDLLIEDIIKDQKFNIMTLGNAYAEDQIRKTLRHQFAQAYLDGANDRRIFESEEQKNG